jgi:hypothetical protein
MIDILLQLERDRQKRLTVASTAYFLLAQPYLDYHPVPLAGKEAIARGPAEFASTFSVP